MCNLAIDSPFGFEFTWLIQPVANSRMKRYNPKELYRLGKLLAYLSDMPEEIDQKEFFLNTMQGRFILEHLSGADTAKQLSFLLKGSWVGFSEGSSKAAAHLLKHLKEATKDPMIGKVSPFARIPIKDAVDALENALLTDFEGLRLYNIEHVLTHDPGAMIDHGEWLITESLRGLLTPETISDIQQATRCAAFDLPTALGFHMGRAMEAIVRLYFAATVGPVPMKASNPTTPVALGNLLDLMEKDLKANNASKLQATLVNQIRFVKDEYRNPVSHPGEELSIEDGHKLMSVYPGLFISLLDEVRKVAP